MKPKYSVDYTVCFTFEGREYTGIIQGLKQATDQGNGNQESRYWIWTGDQGMWVRESWIASDIK